MNKNTKPSSVKITPYQLFGWVPLLLVVIGSSIVVILSVISKQ